MKKADLVTNKVVTAIWSLMRHSFPLKELFWADPETGEIWARASLAEGFGQMLLDVAYGKGTREYRPEFFTWVPDGEVLAKPYKIWEEVAAAEIYEQQMVIAGREDYLRSPMRQDLNAAKAFVIGTVSEERSRKWLAVTNPSLMQAWDFDANEDNEILGGAHGYAHLLSPVTGKRWKQKV